MPVCLAFFSVSLVYLGEREEGNRQLKLKRDMTACVPYAWLMPADGREILEGRRAKQKLMYRGGGKVRGQGQGIEGV